MQYQLTDIKVGDWIIVGTGYHAVGWNSALDHDWTRQIGPRIYEVRSVTPKSIVPVQNAWSRDRFEIDQVIAVFDSQEQAAVALAEGKDHWTSYTMEIADLQERLRALKVDRFITTTSRIRAKTNR